MPSFLTPNAEDDERYRHWLEEQANPGASAFTPLYLDPTKNPIALEADPTRRLAYGDPERPRDALASTKPADLPPGVTPPAYWQGQPGANQEPRPAVAAPSAQPSIWEVFADRQHDKVPPAASYAVPTASRASSGGGLSDDAGMALAMFADMMINKGRGGADILKFYQGAPEREAAAQDRQLDRRYKQAQIDKLNRPAKAGFGDELALLRYNQGEHRLHNEEETARLKAEKDVKLHSMDSDETKEVRAAAVAAGAYLPEEAATLNGYQILTYRPQQTQYANQIRGEGYWNRHFKKTQAAELGKEGRAEVRDIGKEGRTLDRDLDKRDQDFAQEYAKQNATDLSIAGLIQDAEKIPGGVGPQTLPERINDALGTWGMDPTRLESWQIKRLITEQWSREQSGAAISGSEKENFAVQTGSSPQATQQQAEIAFRTMKRVIARRLGGAAISNPDVARRIGEVYELDGSWFPRTPLRSRSRPTSPAAAPAVAPKPKNGKTWTKDDIEDLY